MAAGIHLAYLDSVDVWLCQDACALHLTVMPSLCVFVCAYVFVPAGPSATDMVGSTNVVHHVSKLKSTCH